MDGHIVSFEVTWDKADPDREAAMRFWRWLRSLGSRMDKLIDGAAAPFTGSRACDHEESNP